MQKKHPRLSLSPGISMITAALLLTWQMKLAHAQPANEATAPQSLQVPTLAYDDTQITLVWRKPQQYAQVADYEVFQDGKSLGLASANNSLHSPAHRYIDQFYKDDVDNFHVKIQSLSFLVNGLKPATSYRFSVRAVYKDGTRSQPSEILLASTAASNRNLVDVSNIVTMGETNSASVIAANTLAIQKAIDDCTQKSSSANGCKLLIPRGVVVSGALFLKSNMSFEVAEGATLKASPYAKDFPIDKGYQLYSYNSTGPKTDDRRSPSLINLLSPEHLNGRAKGQRVGYEETRAAFSNVRLIGKGRIDGNGWERSDKDEISETGAKLPQFLSSSANTWAIKGVLAKSQVQAGVDEGMSETDAYNYRRSSLVTFRGVDKVYVGGLTFTNPGFHGVMFIESENIVFAATSNETFDVNNADGVEFGNSDKMLVFNNFFDTGDDNVNFAAGQGKKYEKANPCQNGWIFNNYMREGHGMLSLGSHTSAWIQDLLFEDNVGYLTDNGLRLKTTPHTGGGVRRVTFRDNAMRSVGSSGNTSVAGGRSYTDFGNTGQAFVFTMAYNATPNNFAFEPANQSAQYRDITISNVTLDNINTSRGGEAIKIDSYDGKSTSLPYPEVFHENISFSNLRIKNARPAHISRLKNSSFNNIQVMNAGKPAPAPWWVFTASNPGNTWTNVNPAPSTAAAPSE